MNDRELLELAAKAAGYVIDEPARNGSSWAWVYPDGAALNEEGEHPSFKWNPLNDDGDALRLAVTLKLVIDYADVESATWVYFGEMASVSVSHKSNKFDATRRAIAIAAAEIGRQVL